MKACAADVPDDETIKACTRAIAKGGWDIFIAYYARAAALGRQSHCDRAISDINEALRIVDREPAVRKHLDAGERKYFLVKLTIFKTDLYLECAEDYASALATIEGAFTIDPRHTDVFGRRARIRIQLKQYDAAFADFQRAIELAGKRDVAYNNRGRAYFMIGDYDRAIRDYNRALAIKPKFAGYYFARGGAYRYKGEYDLSLADLNKAIQLDPKHAEALTSRGQTYLQKGDLNLALADIDRAIELQSARGDPPILALSYRGDLLRFRGQYAQALQEFDRAIGYGPDLPYAWVGRGLTHERMGDLGRAREDFEKALTFPEYALDTTHEAQTTARARLAALDAGEAPPVIPPVPPRLTSETSVPTAALTAPILTKPLPPTRLQATAAKQGRRVALVIGIAAYEKVSPLRNPLNDAEAVAKTLRNIGFDSVTVATDTSRDRLTAALQKFAHETDDADWAVVYYSGHGIELNGRNYLLPTNAVLRTDRDVQFETVPMEQVMGAIDGARKLKLVVLDACRDNPFTNTIAQTARRAATSEDTSGGEIRTRSVGRGLGEVKVKGASLVVFAAKHGQTALDGEGSNSPFAIALVQRMATPGVELNKVFRLVRDDVMEATAGRQEPYTYGSLPGSEDFYFVAK